MISVRSEVQVFPGPPAFAAFSSFGSAGSLERRLPRRSAGEGGLVDASFGSAGRQAFVFWYGAIAQLGERVLCKHEVVGSIPSGSTSLRWLRQLRLGKPILAKAAASKPERAKTGRLATNKSSAKTSIRTRCPPGCACGISDIVKRRSIRVWDLAKQFARSQSLSPDHFGARAIARLSGL